MKPMPYPGRPIALESHGFVTQMGNNNSPIRRRSKALWLESTEQATQTEQSLHEQQTSHAPKPIDMDWIEINLQPRNAQAKKMAEQATQTDPILLASTTVPGNNAADLQEGATAYTLTHLLKLISDPIMLTWRRSCMPWSEHNTHSEPLHPRE